MKTIHRVKACVFALLLAASGFGVARGAEPAPIKWTPVYKGVELAEFTEQDPVRRFIAARIDMTAPGIAIKTTEPHKDFAPDERETYRETTPQFLKKNGLALAVNGNWYSPFGGETITRPGDANLEGLAVSAGFVESKPEPGFPSFVLRKDGKMEIRQFEADEDLSDIVEAVSGPALALKDGKVVPNEDKAVHPRTAIGYSADQRYLFLLVIDGRRPGYSEGETYEGTGAALLRLGASDGIVLDGGGSTTMAVRDAEGEPLVLNWPCNRRISPDGLRYNGNAIGITAEGAPLQKFEDVLEIKHTDYVKWTPVRDGLSIATWTEENPLRAIYAARIELEKPGVTLKTTGRNKNFEPEKRETRRVTTAKFMTENDLEIAINANFYNPFNATTIKTEGDSNLLGLAVADGEVVSASQNGRPSFIMKKDGTPEIRQVGLDESLDDVELAVSGNLIVLEEGVVPEIKNKDIHPRTGVGISYDKQYLYFVVIDGRQKGYSDGATYAQVGETLKFCGAFNGVNLDGGGSTTMVLKGKNGEPVVLNRPCNTTPDLLRNNANSLGADVPGELQTELKDGRGL